MTDHIDWDRLARYVSGEAGARERAEVEGWAAADSRNRAVLDSVRRRWELSAEGSQWDVNAAWHRMAARLEKAQAGASVLPLRPRRAASSWLRMSRLIPLAAAAVLVIAVASTLGRGRGADEAGASIAAGARLATAVGETRTFSLSDGSHLTLGAASSVRIGDGFDAGSREVFLDGQAFVRVTHDAAHPFVVNAGGTRTVDVGTAFEVRAYPNEGVRVAVSEGAVEIHRAGAQADSVPVLQAGDVAHVDASGTATIQRQQDIEQLLGWMRGELAFADAPLSQVARELERWFDVDCRIEDPGIEDLHLTMRLRIGESLDEILNLVNLSLAARGVRTERDGRVVTFRGGAAVTPSALPRTSAPRRVEAGA